MLAATLQRLAKASGLSVTDIATAIPKAGIQTVNAWLRGDKLPGYDQIEALARTLGVPAGALLGELAAALDPARTRGEHELLACYRRLEARQQHALLEVVRSMQPAAPQPASRTATKTAASRSAKPRAALKQASKKAPKRKS
ncbi:helix-turn-helix transcriptional regulator [Thermomonas sp.]|uniref:helix-turn-helix domain-containing protein n=1 Tax=Thermomonas sp. TaxID=1971895 RepID=UPI0026205A4E|nr:helix-turn-helix transcriptional regulator [Thermomonas sp.]MCO5056045.1 helix-turn-helix domain-containing protein [Thermomonas sp.]